MPLAPIDQVEISGFRRRRYDARVTEPASIEVLITDGNRRPSLAVARSLARQGVEFLAVSDTPHSLTQHSRHVRHWQRVASPSDEPDKFFEQIVELVRRHQIKLVIPVLEKRSLLARFIAFHSEKMRRSCLLTWRQPRPI